MRLSEIVSGAGLSAYAEIAMLLFFLAFLGILWMVFAPRFRAKYDAASRMPLDDDTPQTPRPRTGGK
jgi:cbb3-type cytochrome oxidase subunit 3